MQTWLACIPAVVSFLEEQDHSATKRSTPSHPAVLTPAFPLWGVLERSVMSSLHLWDAQGRQNHRSMNFNSSLRGAPTAAGTCLMQPLCLVPLSKAQRPHMVLKGRTYSPAENLEDRRELSQLRAMCERAQHSLRRILNQCYPDIHSQILCR